MREELRRARAWAHSKRDWARVLLIALSPTLGLICIFLGDRALYSGRVGRGVWVCDVALAGLDRARAERALHELEGRLRVTPVGVRLRDAVFELDPARVGYRLDVRRTLDMALASGRTGNALKQLAWWLERWIAPYKLHAAGRVDGARLHALLSVWEKSAIAELPFEGGLTVRDGELIAQYPRAGQHVDRPATERSLVDALGRERQHAVELSIVPVEPELDKTSLDALLSTARAITSTPVDLIDDELGARLHVEPEVLRRAVGVHFSASVTSNTTLEFRARELETAIAELRKNVERAPRDAEFVIDEEDRVSVLPSQSGMRVVAADVARALLEASTAAARVGPLPVELSADPAFATDHARALHIERLVAKFSTFHVCCQPRVQNIHRIANLLDGKLVRPGETFSLNAAVGERTIKNGFVAAPSIEDGEMVDTVGGGVSQFATTFFNAVFYGGYDIVERQPHSYWFSRYPMGHEATLSWPKPDVIFRNDTTAGVLVKTSHSDKSITVKLFGNNGGRTVKATISARQDIVEPSVELLPNPALAPDEEKTKESGTVGWSVIVARQIGFPDGTTKEERRKVTYKPRVRRVEVHPCRIPEGEPGHTGERCVVPAQPTTEDAGGADESALPSGAGAPRATE